jgi:hypothetical protein
MKYLFIVLIIALSSCKKEKDSSFVLNQSFTLAQGTKACLSSENVCLTFEKVTNDSRCPSTAICFWEGVAEVNFLLQINQASYPFTLHTLKKLQYRKDTVIQGYTVKLEQLSPYPDGKRIDHKDYRAQVIISK